MHRLNPVFTRRPLQRISSKARDERGSCFSLAFELAFAALPYDFEQGMRSSLIAKEQLHLCRSDPHDSCGLAAKCRIRADVRGKIRAEGEELEYKPKNRTQ